MHIVYLAEFGYVRYINHSALCERERLLEFKILSFI